MSLNRPIPPDVFDADRFQSPHRAIDLVTALALDLQRLRRRQEAGGRDDPEDRLAFDRLGAMLGELVTHLRAEQNGAGPAEPHPLRAMPSSAPAEPSQAPLDPWTFEEAADFVRRTERAVEAELSRLEADMRAALPGCSLVVHRCSPEFLARWKEHFAPDRPGIALVLVRAGTAQGKTRRAAVWAGWDGARVWSGDSPDGDA